MRAFETLPVALQNLLILCQLSTADNNTAVITNIEDDHSTHLTCQAVVSVRARPTSSTRSRPTSSTRSRPTSSTRVIIHYIC